MAALEPSAGVELFLWDLTGPTPADGALPVNVVLGPQH
jgi:hypothetical protein